MLIGIPEFDSMSDSSFISLSSSSSSLVCLSFLFHISVLLFLSSKCTILRFVLSERCVKKNQLTMLMTLRRIAIYQKVLLILDRMRVWNWWSRLKDRWGESNTYWNPSWWRGWGSKTGSKRIMRLIYVETTISRIGSHSLPEDKRKTKQIALGYSNERKGWFRFLWILSVTCRTCPYPLSNWISCPTSWSVFQFCIVRTIWYRSALYRICKACRHFR